MQLNILISIVSWRSLDKVDALLDTFINSLPNGWRILVIETGGRKTSESRYYKRKEFAIEYIHMQNNGFAASHQLSVEMMIRQNMDGILLLNPDLILGEKHLEKLHNCIIASNNEVVIGAPIFNKKDNGYAVEYLGYPVPKSLKDITEGLLASLVGVDDLHESYNVTDIHGCFMYIPSIVVKRNGWMDTHYFLYGEENEYFRRLISNNEQIKIFTDLYIVHQNGGTFDNDTLKGIREYYRTRNRLYNHLKFLGVTYLFKVNYSFLLKYFIGRYVFRIKSFQGKDLNYYNFLGHLHFFTGKRGRTLNPNDYVKE